MNKDLNGQAVLEGDCIVIRVPFNTLQTVVDGAYMLGSLQTRIKVTDTEIFAKELCRELNTEDEQGTTLVHRAFDTAIDAAWDNGAEGLSKHKQQNI